MGVKFTRSKRRFAFFGAAAGGVAVVLATALTSLVLILTGEELWGLMLILLAAHIPVIIIELVVVGSVTTFLARVKPEMLKGVKR